MDNRKKIEETVELLELLEKNKLETPNAFTVGMGQLIRKAREEKGFSQADFAAMVNRRPATISHIENGKSDISILTLFLFSLKLGKPISYFIPPSFMKDQVFETPTAFQEEILKLAQHIEYEGDPGLTLEIMKVLSEKTTEEFE